MKNLKIVTHPLVAELVTKLRDVTTCAESFRKYTRIITQYILYEALTDAQMREVKVETQTGGIYTGAYLKNQMKFFGVLREGIGMLISPMETLSDAEFDLVGVKRNDSDPFGSPATMYFDSFKNIGPHVKHVVIMDQMFATGSTMLIILDALFNKYKFSGDVDVVSVIATEQGVKKVLKSYPQVRITCAGYDAKLTDKGYIFPGLGDAADRYFNTVGNDNHTI